MDDLDYKTSMIISKNTFTMKEERFWVLISRILADEATEKERLEFMTLIGNDSALKAKSDTLHAFWQLNKQSNKYASEEAFQKLILKLSAKE